MRILVNCTYRCNARCTNCHLAIGLARFHDTEMTAGQMRFAVNVMAKHSPPITAMTMAGAEALLNPELEEIIKEADRLPHLVKAKILTNGLDKKRRKTLSLPPRWKWYASPLKDPANPRSGKNHHVPYFVSPADFGVTASYDACRVRRRCGLGLDANGWSMCTLAGTLGRLLRINPYKMDGPTREEVPGICQHCTYGLPKRKHHAFVMQHVSQPISKTFAKALEMHNKDPLEFKRLQDG